MDYLDKLNKLQIIDRQNVLGSIQALPDQIKQTWNEVGKLNIPERYRKASNIVVSGMGGSALGARVIQSTFTDSLSIPLTISNSYDLPSIVNSQTLFIASSYSGTTEETIEALNKAIKRQALIFCITTGGELAKLARKHKLPAYIFFPKFNPSNQPRMALGYSVISQLALLNHLGILKISTKDIKDLLACLAKINATQGQAVPTQKNLIKRLSESIKGKIPIFIGGEFLGGSLHTLRNQFNENTKSFADYHLIPELNHHLMEGLKHPHTNKQNLIFVFFESKLYSEKILRRMSLTQEIVSKNGISYAKHLLLGKTKLKQAFELVHLGSYLNYYVALLYGQNPAPIPWVDYFKNQLKQTLVKP